MKFSRSRCAIPAAVDLQSLVDSHEQPFVVIDGAYRIVAFNQAYERAFGLDKRAIGQPCYRVTHNHESPCHETGEDCPHLNLFELGRQDCCLHTHHDASGQLHRVRVSAYPLRGSDGDLYMGELIQELTEPARPGVGESPMVGATLPFLACLEQLRMTASSQAPVLLQGETGTGKELAANYIHRHSPRRDKPFLTVDCTVLTESLFEAEVFGHARGAYTGSVGEHIGLFEQADGGTLFLDEIGELPLSQQAKLLRALETGQFRRVGGRRVRTADVRIVCATNRHLWEGVTSGQFREDLYYRVACLAVRLPPLRERLEDIRLLAPALLEPICCTAGRRLTLTDDAIEQLTHHHYPGNVRELRNILLVAATHCSNGQIDAAMIEAVLRQLSPSVSYPVAGNGVAAATHAREAAPLAGTDDRSASPATGATLQELEAQHIAQLLTQHNQNRRKVASLLEISERTLYRKLKRYHLNN